jgi:hypothetical protein
MRPLFSQRLLAQPRRASRPDRRVRTFFRRDLAACAIVGMWAYREINEIDIGLRQTSGDV